MIKEIEIKNEYGYIKYKLPSVTDRLRMLSKLNLQGKSEKDMASQFDLSMFADIIEQGSRLITVVDVKVGDQVIDSWENLQYVDECTDLIMQFGTALLQGRQSHEDKEKVKKAKK